MGIVKKLLSIVRPRRAEASSSQTTINASVEHDAFADILDGYEFAATLQLRTPLHVLEHHGEVFRGRPEHTPVYGSGADGIWVPKTRDDIGAAEPPGQTCASDVGSVSADTYLPFLKAYRRIVESMASANDKLAQIRELGDRSGQFAAFYSALERAYPGFPESRFELTIDSLPNVGKARRMHLKAAGLTRLEDLAQSSIAGLTAVEGIGQSTATRIQAEAQKRLQGARTPIAGERLP